MPASTEENTNTNEHATCQSSPQAQPCACCAALAQLRMPWMDVAMQHAPHYPYYTPPQLAPQNYAQQREFEQDEVEDQDDAQKTFFFKLLELSNSKKKKQASKNSRNSKARHGSASAAQQGIPGSQSRSSEAKNLSAAGGGTGSADPARDFRTGAASESSQNDADTKADDATDASWEAPLDSPKKKKMQLNFGLRGLAVSTMGIILPTFVLAGSILSTPKRITLVALHHPVETIIEFLLVAGIPLANFLVWSAISKNKASISRWLTTGLGSACGAALCVSALSFACLFANHDELTESVGSDFSAGFIWLGIISLLSAAVSVYLINRLRENWELSSTRRRVMLQAGIGLTLALLGFLGSEIKPFSIRMAQHQAISKDDKTRAQGLHWLRQLNPEREMRMECSDARAAGIAGLFYPIKAGKQQELYFTLTGTPYSFRDMNTRDLSSMPDDYLSRHVVGDKIPQLDLTRSTLNGILHADTLSSTLNWTFVVKNSSSQDQEMRAELGLPPGSAVTGLSVWKKGEPEDADFVEAGEKLDGVNANVAGANSPASVTDLGHGRVLLHCFPINKEEELKVRVAMIVPLRSEGGDKASLVTPQLIASNFDLEGEHTLRLRSKSKLETNVKDMEKSTNPSGENIISGAMNSDQLESSPLLVSATRQDAGQPIAVLDKLAITLRREDERVAEIARLNRERFKEMRRKEKEKAERAEMGQLVLMIDGSKNVPTNLQDLRKLLVEQKKKKQGQSEKAKAKIEIKPEYTVEEIKHVAAPAPKHLVVVIDGSASMNKFTGDLHTALAKIPSSVPTSVIIASSESEKKSSAKSLSAALPLLSKVKFVGGEDNLKAVVNAAEIAGETPGSAVLWIHGPQPVSNPEQYIMSPYESAPAFYELPVVAGTDTFEFFKNHTEIGPFTQVPRNGNSIASDLSDFFAGWNPRNNASVACLTESQSLPAGAKEAGKEEGKELIMLHAIQECNQLIATRHFHRAARIASRYGFVSSVSAAMVGLTPAQSRDADLSQLQTAKEENEIAVAQEEVSGTDSAKPATDAYSTDGILTSGHYTAAQTMQGGSAAAPMLQGATSGTVEPQGADATVIQGVNTAGTVRVNNLANLEALLNIVANLGEISAILVGLVVLLNAFMSETVLRIGEDIELGRGSKIFLGAILLTFGLSLPGVINWFVASARDANLFS